MTSIVSHLKQTDIFYHLTPTQLEMVGSLCSEVVFHTGDVIVEEGGKSKDLYIIVQGEVDILITSAPLDLTGSMAHETVVTRLRRGQSFGEVALVDEGQRSASVRAAKDDTHLLAIPREKLLMLCETYPQLGYHLMYNLAADLAMKVRNTDLRIREQMLNKPQSESSKSHSTDS